MAHNKGVWVSLAYTRAFGTLGPKFKSWYAHHHSLICLRVNPDYVVAKLSFDELAWNFIYFSLPNTLFKFFNHLTLGKLT